MKNKMICSDWKNIKILNSNARPAITLLSTFLLLLALAGLLTPVISQAASADNFLRAEEAYQLQANSVTSDLIHLEWTIADGYYLYRKRFKFVPLDEGISFGEPIFPKGKIKNDEFFGEMEVYYHKVGIDIPIIASGDQAAKLKTLQLKVTSQGCADAGLCYPPQTQNISIKTMTVTESASNATSGGLLNALSSFGQKLGINTNFGSSSGEFLEPDRAFILTVDVTNGNTINARWDIADGYYLYREKFGFTIKDADGVTLGEPQSPPGEVKKDETFGVMEVYHDNVAINVPLIRQTTQAMEVMLEVRYQGCADAGFCYPPIAKLIPLSLPAIAAMSTINSGTLTPVVATQDKPFVSEQDHMANALASGSLLPTLAAFFLAGLVLAFTPCVLPMVPILSSIVVGQKATSTRKAFLLSASYVLAMVLTYTVAGVVAGLSGENLQVAFQTPWIIGVFSLVFVALAFSMFGFYELQLPSSLQSKLTSISNKQGGGTLISAAVMGFLSALIVGPCVAAPLAGALIYIGQTGDAVLGGMALFFLSLGMGTPLLVIGTSAGKLLPKVGPWMNTVKSIFGVLLLGLAIWMLERILPAQVALLLWAILAIVCAVYLGALRRLEADATGWQKLWQGTGLVLLVSGVIWLVAVASGSGNMLRPLAQLNVNTTGADGFVRQASHLEFKPIKGLAGLNTELAAAKVQGKPVMLDFYADWCVSCQEMENHTFADLSVQQSLANVVLLQADVTANDAQDQALLKHFGVFGPPSIIFYDHEGNEKENYRVVGFMEASDFRDHVLNAF